MHSRPKITVKGIHMALAEFSPTDEDVVAPTDPSWRDEANCRGRTKLFFAPKAERPQARARREAKAQKLCDGCTVNDECMSFARANREYGFWAGESEEERHLKGFTVSAPIGIRARHHNTAS